MNSAGSAYAEITPLPEAEADKILSSPVFHRIVLFNTWGTPLWFILTIGGGFAGMDFYHASVDESDPRKFYLSVLFFGISAFTALLCAIFVGMNGWLRRIARREINRRSAKIVNLDNPDAKFVEIVPKSNWLDTALAENASEVGFLIIDLQKGCLLFEGDQERYRIPACAIVKCEQDSYSRVYGRGSIYFYFAVVTVKVSEQMNVELPIRIRDEIHYLFTSKDRQKNCQLLDAINHLRFSCK